MTGWRARLTDGRDDARLLSHVRPPSWENPKPASLYDLVVIGGGTAGLVSASLAAVLGARVALVERALLGGDCLVTGCVPSKALIRSARAVAEARRGPELGLRSGAVEPEGGDVLSRLRRLRADVAEHDAAARLVTAGIDVFFGDARLTGPAAAEVDGAVLPFRRCILATGARPAVPHVEGLREAGCLTNETVFALESLPRRLVVVGGGPVGCELSQAFARLGVRVTLAQRADRLLPKDDPDASAIVARALAADGVDLRLGTTPVRAERGGDALRVTLRCAMGESLVEADAVLAATGRRANVEGLGLEEAGVALTREGFVAVDDLLRTTNPRIHACGDVAGRWQLTHAADATARLAVQNALLPITRRVSSLVMPWCTYTDPEVAHAGMTAAEAARRDDVVTVTADMADVDRAIVDGETTGFARLHVRRRGGRILGATLVGSHAGESVTEATLAIRARVTAGTLEDTIHCYPTQAEALRRAAAAWRRRQLRAFVPRLLHWWYERL